MDNGTPDQPLDQLPRSEPAPPEPSYAPFLLALGITLIFWGVVTSPVMSMGGLVLFVAAMWLWLGAIAKGWRK
jgi:hypothetical protein